MELTPREKDELLIFTAALLAERRMARRVKLNYPEAVAYLSAATSKGRATGGRSHGATLLTRDDVMDGVPEMVAEVQVEATFTTAPSWSWHFGAERGAREAHAQGRLSAHPKHRIDRDAIYV